jgi:tRNA(fMet)-specific endonuclease VapC
MRYMFDTNICIHLIQQQPQSLIQRCEALAYGDVVLSSIVLAELRHGVERHASQREQAKAALSAMLNMFPVLPFGDAAAQAYGRLCAAVPDRRRDALDRLIAAHAVSLNLALVTNNEADFLDFPDLRLENWVNN